MPSLGHCPHQGQRHQKQTPSFHHENFPPHETTHKSLDPPEIKLKKPESEYNGLPDYNDSVRW